MDETSENDGNYRLGRHWQTIQGSLFPEWEMDQKFIDEERRRQAEAEAEKAGRVSR